MKHTRYKQMTKGHNKITNTLKSVKESQTIITSKINKININKRTTKQQNKTSNYYIKQIMAVIINMRQNNLLYCFVRFVFLPV